MLKKAGIVVAAAAAGLLAVSPLAFAGEKGHHGHDGGPTAVNSVEDDSNTVGLVNVTDNNVSVPVQVCNNDVPIQGGFAQGQVPIDDVTAALSGALALFGNATSDATATADNSRNCEQASNAGDLTAQNIG